MRPVSESARNALAGLSVGRPEALERAMGTAAHHRDTGLDERTFALVKLAALVALDAPPSSYASEVAAAVEAGVSPDEIVGVLHAIGPQVGEARVVAAAPELMLALGLSLPDSGDLPENGT